MKTPKKFIAIVAIAMSFIMLVGFVPTTAVSSYPTEQPPQSLWEIVGFAPLSLNIAEQTVPIGTQLAGLNLPTSLTATVWQTTTPAAIIGQFSDSENLQNETETTENSETETPQITEEISYIEMEIAVDWVSSPEFDGNIAAVYGFTPIISGDFAVLAELPVILVAVGESGFAPLNLPLPQLPRTTTPKVITYAAGSVSNTTALRADGTVWDWGRPSIHYTQYSRTPGRLSLENIIDISIGQFYGIALKSDGTVWSWGRGTGDGTGQVYTSAHTRQIQGINNIVAIFSRGFTSFALDNNGNVWAWGSNSYGILGESDSIVSVRNTPAQIQGINNVVDISIGSNYVVALKNDGTVWSWGYNSSGQLGNGTTTNTHIPVQVYGLQNIVSVNVYNSGAVALKNDGTVWSWGAGSGQLGNGTTTGSSIPVQAEGIRNAVHIWTANSTTFALLEDSTVWAWGLNSVGQTGSGSQEYIITLPTQVQNIDNILHISGSAGSAIFALDNNGVVWTWGGNLLVNTTINRTPIKIQNTDNFIDIYASNNGYSYDGDHVAGIRDDGTVWAWGSNRWGNLGDGTTTNRLNPVQVVGENGEGYFNVFGDTPPTTPPPESTTITFDQPTFFGYRSIRPTMLTATVVSPTLVPNEENITWRTSEPHSSFIDIDNMTVETLGNYRHEISMPVYHYGIGTIEITATTEDGATATATIITEDYDSAGDVDSLFGNQLIFYNHNLAREAINISALAYNENDIVGYFSKVGFSHLFQDKYESEEHTVGHTFARRNVLINGVPRTIIIVAIRGTHGEKEWRSNFDIRENSQTASTNHFGFYTAMRDVLQNLNNYITKHNLQYNRENNIVLITGHSRGAAVANLLTHQLNISNNFVLPENMVAYTFATPNTTTAPGGLLVDMNLYNIIAIDDFVTFLPLAEDGWNFGRHGSTLVLPIDDGQIGHFVGGINVWGLLFGGPVVNTVRSMHGLAGNVGEFYTNAHPARIPPTYVDAIDSDAIRFAHISPRTFFQDIVSPVAGGNNLYRPIFIANLFPEVRESGFFGDVIFQASEYRHIARFLAYESFLQDGTPLSDYVEPLIGRLGIFSGHLELVRRLFLESLPAYDEVYSSHNPDIYIRRMGDPFFANTTSDFATVLWGRGIRVNSDVDVSIYDSRNRLVGRIIDNVIDETLNPENIFIAIDGVAKNIYLPADEEYTIHFTATGEGTMTFNVSDINFTNVVTDAERNFANITLQPGREFIGDINTTAPESRLFVVENGERVAEIMEDGREVPINGGGNGNGGNGNNNGGTTPPQPPTPQPSPQPPTITPPQTPPTVPPSTTAPSWRPRASTRHLRENRIAQATQPADTISTTIEMLTAADLQDINIPNLLLLFEISILLNGNAVDEIDGTALATVNLANLGLTAEQQNQLSAILIYTNGEETNFIPINGTLNGDNFNLQVSESGLYGIILVQQETPPAPQTEQPTEQQPPTPPILPTPTRQPVTLSANSNHTTTDGELLLAPIFRLIPNAENPNFATSYVMARVVADVLGLTVNWNAETGTATFSNATTTVSLTDGAANAMVNGLPMPITANGLAANAQIVEGRFFVPVAFFAEVFPVQIDWNAAAAEITIR
ncbi:MAG: stalk domain-containing protein [Firmicutes bacterium]|nr:stalk domain-containing protein [Bacillota bacterium]